jgi:hypothetical protein
MGPTIYDRPLSVMSRSYGSIPEIPSRDAAKEGYQDL